MDYDLEAEDQEIRILEDETGKTVSRRAYEKVRTKTKAMFQVSGQQPLMATT